LQIDALRQAGCERIFIETASGARADRTELAKLMETVRNGDTIVCWRLDRIGRSLRHLIDIAEQLQLRGIALRSLTEAIDTGTTSGRFLFNILGAFGQMEREIIVERTRAGLIAAAARGRRGGRPAALDDAKIRAARAMLASGNLSAAEVAQHLGCAASTLYRHLPGGRTAITEIAASVAA
jgi:DNA invertase Pin-like site-specific DNA recombinase